MGKPIRPREGGPSFRRAGGRPSRYPGPVPQRAGHHEAAIPKPTDNRFTEEFPGTNLTPDQVEFGMAMERYMRLQCRPFPTWHEVLAVLTALGYRKVAPRAPRPERPDSE